MHIKIHVSVCVCVYVWVCYLGYFKFSVFPRLKFMFCWACPRSKGKVSRKKGSCNSHLIEKQGRLSPIVTFVCCVTHNLCSFSGRRWDRISAQHRVITKDVKILPPTANYGLRHKLRGIRWPKDRRNSLPYTLHS